MESINWAELQKVADEAGVGTDLPDDNYEVKVVDTRVGQTQGNPPKPQIGVFLEVQGGPYAGKRFWDNLNLTVDSPKAVAMFIKNAKGYGVGDDLFARNASLEDMAAAMVGTVGVAKVNHRDWNGQKYLNVASFKRHNGAAVPGVLPGPVGAGQTTPGPVPSGNVPPPPVPVPGTSF